MNSFQYFIATLQSHNYERITLFTSPEELNIHVSPKENNTRIYWDDNLDTIEQQFWVEQVYNYISNDNLWAGSVNISYNTEEDSNNITFLAYKELLLPTNLACHSSYYLTLDNKSKGKVYEPFPKTLIDYEPLKLYKKLQLSLPNKDPAQLKNKI